MCEVRISCEFGADRTSGNRVKHSSKVSIMTYLTMFKGGLHGTHSGKDNLGGGRQV